ncbi:YeiH family protein [Propionibacteriaceae bacterium G57]|uniref:YeiH family protein n=1 Tax=Aestuariimicrobium sp. G57 TaxID=3418485 RepID=UPI003DA73303
MTTTKPEPPAQRPSPVPGLAICLAAALVGLLVSHFVPVLSALLVAILLGVVVGNVRPQVAQLHPGIGIAAKQLLRAGIVLLGLKISLGDIAGLGWPVIALVCAIVAIGMVASYSIGRALGLDEDLSMLVAAGFSICGAAAVAAVDGVIRPRKEAVAQAIALVVLFGTTMIAFVPVVARLAGLGDQQAALWAGGGTHEVAQVVAIGGIMGGGAVLATAVIVKLARVMLLAPVMVGVAIWQRRRVGEAGRRPPLVQGFVVGFIIAVLVRTFVPLPGVALDAAGLLQTVLLAMAMFALGLGVNRKVLAKASGRALLFGVLATVAVNVVALGGALIIG